MNDHADFDLIAAFREGLLDQEGGELVGHHLGSCALCAERRAALDEVTTRLADDPTPPLPPQLAQRLDAALAAEIAVAHREATAAARNGTQDTEPVTEPVTAPAPAPPHVRRPHATRHSKEPARRRLAAAMLRPLAAAAAVLVVAGGGYLAFRAFAPGSSSAPSAVRPATSLGAPGGGRASQHPMVEPQGPTGGVAVLTVTSGTSYQATSLRADAVNVLRRYASSLQSPGKARDTTAQPFGTPLSGCLQRVSQGRKPLIVDQATYQGHPARVIIAPANASSSGQVWVVGSRCSASTSDVIAQSRL